MSNPLAKARRPFPLLSRGSIQRLFDHAESWSLLATIVRVGGSLFLLPLILRKIPPDQLGLWYLFLSLGAATTMLDFGLQPTVTRAVAALWAGAPALRPTGIECSTGTAAHPPNLGILAPTVGCIRETYGIIAVISATLMAVLGAFLVCTPANTSALSPTANVAWYVFLATTAYSAFARWSPAVLSGMDGMRDMARFTLYGGVLGLLVMGAALLAGGGILSLALGQGVPPLLTALFSRRAILRKTGWYRIPARSSFSTLRTLWPSVWRMGTVAVGAYLINNINTIYCSRYLGLEATASYGLSLQIIVLVHTTAAILVSTQLPKLVELRVQHRVNELRALVGQRIVLASALFLGGAMFAWLAGPYVLGSIGSRTLLLPSGQLAFLMGYRFLEFNHSSFALVITTENEVPFVAAALVSGMAIALLGFPAVYHFGMWGLLGTTAIVQLAYNNWWPIKRCADGLQISVTSLYAQEAKRLWRSIFPI